MTGEVFEVVFDVVFEVVFDAAFEDVFELVFEEVFELVFEAVFLLGLLRLRPERVKPESLPDPEEGKRPPGEPVLWVCVRPFPSTVLAVLTFPPRLS